MIWLTKQICETFTDGETGKLYQFFSRNWKKIEAYENFGDELEVSWQILDCTNILANKAGLRKEAEKTAVILANHTLENGFDRECGGMYLEKDQRGTIRNKEWWAQAEAVNGYLSIYFITKEEKYLQAAYMCWQFIRTYLIMPEGDWRWCVSRTGSETLPEPKQGPRKCPYHNTRMLLRLKNAVESMEERKDKSNASG
jgi:mannobiose 2-epimerase